MVTDGQTAPWDNRSLAWRHCAF